MHYFKGYKFVMCTLPIVRAKPSFISSLKMGYQGITLYTTLIAMHEASRALSHQGHGHTLQCPCQSEGHMSSRPLPVI